MRIAPEDSSAPIRRKRFLFRDALMAMAVLAALATLAGAVGAVILLRRPDTAFDGAVLLAVGSLFMLGLIACGLLLTALHVTQQLGRLQDSAAALEQRTAVLAEQSVARSQSEPSSSASRIQTAELRGVLEEIRETLLLPAEERIRRFGKLVEREFQRGLAAADRHILSRDFHRAREELMALADRFGSDQRVREAEQRLESAAQAAQADDLEQVRRATEDLMSMGRWDEADRITHELADKYPMVAEPAALLIRVQRERKLYEVRHRQRLHEEIQQFAHQRRWQDAVQAARTFIENFPTGPDTEALRAQLDTLVANAEIQTRQELEQQLKEQVRLHQYWDAVGLARRIINDFPLSPQANVLRNQLPRLEELARKQAPQT